MIGVGAFLNALAITVNGGLMAASRTAERIAGLHMRPGFENSAPLAHPHLLWFGDIIPLPGPLPNVLSIGDCLIYVGMLVLLHRVCRRSAGQSSVQIQIGVGHLAQPARRSPQQPGHLHLRASQRLRNLSLLEVALEAQDQRLTLQVGQAADRVGQRHLRLDEAVALVYVAETVAERVGLLVFGR